MSGPVLHVRWPDGTTELPLTEPSGEARTLAAQLAAAGRPLNTRCGQRGLCAGCTVSLTEGSFRTTAGDIATAPAEIKACQGHVVGSAAVTVPTRALAAHRPQIATTFKVNVPSAQDPLVPVHGGATTHGLAIDIGTTTVVVALVDLASGEITHEVSGFNRQIEMGDNVLTRIQQAAQTGGLEALRRAIVADTLQPLIEQVCRAAAVPSGRLGAVTVAGNTTMLHLLTGTDPMPMGVTPFHAAFLAHRVLTAGDLSLGGAPRELAIHLLPGFSAYVGADLVAGTLCTGLGNDSGPTLLVDVGTNGEIVLHQDGRFYATATAAGPAFEGGRLSCGTRAVSGAVQHVAFAESGFPPRLDFVPGKTQSVGLCGSAYIDFLAEARRSGLLRDNGRFDSARWDALPAPHRHTSEGARGVRLRADDPLSTVTEADIAHLLQAKAAIAAGIVALLRRINSTPEAVRKLYLAGGFGLHLNVDNAIACGLLPGFTRGQVEVVGNTALGGAWLALTDRSVLPEMTDVATQATIVELNLEGGFEDTFIDQLALP